MPLHQDADLVDYDDQPELQDGPSNADTATEQHGTGATFEEGVNTPVQGTYVGINSAGFRDFFLKAELTRAINDAGFEHPSEVQHEAIPQAICGVDVLCQAKSGMGKTAVFVLSVLNQLKPISEMSLAPGQVFCLGLAHTRELAFQIKNEFDRFCKYIEGVIVMVVYGGTNIKDNIKALENPDTSPHILIGTPGRVNQLSGDKHLNLEKLEIFVVDECDKVLDKLDMRHDVQQIFVRTPKQKQVMMFSATFSPEIRSVCRKFMSKPVEVFVDSESKLTLDGLQQYYVKLTEGEKNRKLSDLLDELEFNQVIVFVKSVQRAKILNQLLVECSFPSIAVHGGLPQDKRISLYQSFKNFESRILVSTDLFGRGIDIERVNIVINYDMPDAADTYLHRVGRAGRFGTKGLAVSFISSPDDSAVLDQVQERFEVTIPDMPADISTADYINQ